ncbi:BH3 interacting domain death agonist [Genypterus blacodes]|uniref:BH3 interacting domain death agonist n=1 Tax=Genypterus blacodes TaxID=154954 RepID=UPI003F76F7BB
MDVTGTPKTPLLMLAFLLKTDCGNTEYRKELCSLGKELRNSLDINSNGLYTGSQEEGRLESDGSLPICITGSFDDIQPTVEFEELVNAEEAVHIEEVAAELREIADQFQRRVMAGAAENLSRKLSRSPLNMWSTHLQQEVELLLRHGVVLDQLPQERVIVALTLTLVKGVCEQAPRLLRNVFSTALHYISSVLTKSA